MHRSTVLPFLIVSLFSAVSPAADGGDLQRFHPAPTPWSGLGAGAAETLEPHTWAAGLTLNFARNPLVMWDDGARIWSTVGQNLTAHVTGSYGVFGWLTLEAALPVVAYQTGDEPGFSLAGQAVGDLRLAPRFRLLTQWKHGVALAVAPTITIPLGGASALAGDPSITVFPELSLSVRSGGVTFASQLAVRLRRNISVLDRTVLGPEATLRAAVAFPIGDDVEGVLDLNGGVAFATSDDGPLGNPLEFLAGARIHATPEMTATFGVGTALLSAPGTPDVRIVAGITYGTVGKPPGINACTKAGANGPEELRALGRDADGDGLDDICDLCPAEAETTNGYQDADGCAESDPDGDQIYDPLDECPTVPGIAPTGCPDTDGDGLLDRVDECHLEKGPAPTGCPDRDGDGILDKNDKCPAEPGQLPTGCPDRDGDGILDKDDRCPADPEDKDGFQDEDGCPEPDNDGDGLADVADKCPLEAEDKDGFEDEDGCPDPDNDSDGVLDAKDKCPNEKETINGFQDEDGCPDKGRTLVVVHKEKIEILDRVYFATNKDVIEKRSFGLLKQVALTIIAHPEIAKIRVEGHTDDVGGRVKNIDLSQRRAESVVKFLVKEGVAKDRLTPQGFAFDRPLVPNDSEKNRATNRRVEFMIVSDEPAPAPVSAPAPELPELPPLVP